MKLHDFLLRAQIACHTRAFSPDDSRQIKFCFYEPAPHFQCVLCPLKAFVVAAFPYRPAPEKQDVSLKNLAQRILDWPWHFHG